MAGLLFVLAALVGVVRGEYWECMSMNSITNGQLSCAFPEYFPNPNDANTMGYVDEINQALGDSFLTTTCEWSAFMASVGFKAGVFSSWTESPCDESTGAPYCGRGPLMLKGKANYTTCAAEAACNCPDIATNPTTVNKHAWATAKCVWSTLNQPSLSADVDNGSQEGFVKIAAAIHDFLPSACASLSQCQNRINTWKKVKTCFTPGDITKTSTVTVVTIPSVITTQTTTTTKTVASVTTTQITTSIPSSHTSLKTTPTTKTTSTKTTTTPQPENGENGAEVLGIDGENKKLSAGQDVGVTIAALLAVACLVLVGLYVKRAYTSSGQPKNNRTASDPIEGNDDNNSLSC